MYGILILFEFIKSSVYLRDVRKSYAAHYAVSSIKHKKDQEDKRNHCEWIYAKFYSQEVCSC